MSHEALQALSGQDICRIWETAQSQHPLDRALTILTAACRNEPWEELATLTVGQRDARLLELREKTFGPRLAVLAECSSCGDRLEHSLDVSDIRTESDADRTGDVHQLAANGCQVRFRLPNSADLAAIARYVDVVEARDRLVRECVLEARKDGSEIDVGSLPDTVIASVASQMGECDPQAEVMLEFGCAACGQQSRVLFDIAHFLWAELCAEAKRLLHDVHMLARAYGWTEEEVLSIGGSRRNYYLEMVS